MKEYIGQYKKTIIIFVVLYVFLISMSLIYNNINKDRVLKNYITSKDFVLDDDKIFYKKELSNISYETYLENVKNNIESNYQVLYFDIYSYSLNENRYDYKNGIESYLTSIYDYRDSSINYTYTLKYKSSNIIYKGTYDEEKDKFVCSNEYSLDAYIENDSSYCDLIKEYVKEFNNTALETITSTKILSYIKN